MSSSPQVGTDVRDGPPEVHAQIEKVFLRALNELPGDTQMTMEALRLVADRAAEFLGVPPGYFELGSVDAPCPTLRYVGDCWTLAKLRGWRHGDH